MKRSRIEISGLVQGVGFRPFVYRLAIQCDIRGFISNTKQGVLIEAEGVKSNIDQFLRAINQSLPPAALIGQMDQQEIPIIGDQVFRIEPSTNDGKVVASMPHDRATCAACLQEFYNPGDRRFQYPFITCNDCGPRFTIARALPFDRLHTSMSSFALCHDCQSEYKDPTNRRFHAQTMSCQACGPRLTFRDHLSTWQDENALHKAARTIQSGGLVAIKGVGGYQLVCSAKSQQAIARIRDYKARPMKPLAVVAPCLRDIEGSCNVSAAEAACLESPIAPVTILYIKESTERLPNVHPDVNPGLSTLGVMLPSNPILHRLIHETGLWLVVTSANRNGEPMYTDDEEASEDLAGIVDGILSHDRAITHLADDSVVRFAGDQMITLRHARGLAPTELKLQAPNGSQHDVVADVTGFGGQTKASFALATGPRRILGQHIGDLTSRRACDVFMRELHSFEKIYDLDRENRAVVCDAHPGYQSSTLAEATNCRMYQVFHHEAHLGSLISERGLESPALAVVCDGTGFGRDGSVWGGEFFWTDGNRTSRVGSILPFRLPGGDQAIRDPRRSAVGMLYEVYGDSVISHPFAKRLFEESQVRLLLSAMSRGLNSPVTTSLGRLFDGFAALTGICDRSDYEAHAAMVFEAEAQASLAHRERELTINWTKDHSDHLHWDWRPLVHLAQECSGSLNDRRWFASAFHTALVDVIRDMASRQGVKKILLTGGVFQNALLVERCSKTLGAVGFDVITHLRVPPGDGGLSLGQIYQAQLIGDDHVSWRSR